MAPALEEVGSVKELEAKLQDPTAFLERSAKSMGPAAKKIVLAKLRSKLEPRLKKRGMEWADVAPALEEVDSVEELQAALQDPTAFFEGLAKSMGPAAKKIALAKLRSKLEPRLKKQGLEWADVAPALEEV